MFLYTSAIIMGMVLGLLGGGGSILTVPILTYLFDIKASLSTSYSLFIVGIAALIGSLKSFHLINFKTGLTFAFPSFLGVFFARKWLIDILAKYVEIDQFLLILFAFIMLLASLSMIFKKESKPKQDQGNKKFFYIAIEGLVVGVLTGLVGAGGGFVIIPALIHFGGLNMKEAIPTSLFIIAMKSLTGFTGDLGNPNIDWQFLGIFSLLAVIGILIGVQISKKIPAKNLKKGFGYFVLIFGIIMMAKEMG